MPDREEPGNDAGSPTTTVDGSVAPDFVSATPQPGRGDVDVVAHRGFAGVNPENTLAAFDLACATGADAVELDVMPSADGDVVVFHDATPSRVTDATEPLASQPVWETPSATLRELDVLGTGEPVPLLAEVLDVVPPEVDLTVEFKNPGVNDVRAGGPLDEDELAARRAVWRPFAERVVDLLSETGHEVLVSSFHEAALAAVRDVAPEVPLAAVLWESVDAGLAVARRHDCEALHVPRNMVPGTAMHGEDYARGPYEDRDLVSIAHEEGRRVTAWTVETWHEAAELRRAGVDGIITDYPDLFRYPSADAAVAAGPEESPPAEAGQADEPATD